MPPSSAPMIRPVLCALLSTLFGVSSNPVQSAEPASASRWWEPCAGTEFDGPEVLGFWRFDSVESVGERPASRRSVGKLAGAEWHPEGRFGGCLERAARHPVSDERHAFLVPRSPALSPAGAFTLEMWLRPKPPEEFPAEL